MPTYRVHEDATVTDGNAPAAEPVTFPAGDIEARDEAEATRLDRLVLIGHAEYISDDPPIAETAADGVPGPRATKPELVAFAETHAIVVPDGATRDEIRTAIDEHLAAAGQEV